MDGYQNHGHVTRLYPERQEKTADLAKCRVRMHDTTCEADNGKDDEPNGLEHVAQDEEHDETVAVSGD